MTPTASGPSSQAEPIKSPALGIGVALAAYFALVLPFFGYFPLWDTLEYLEQYLFFPRAQQHPTFQDVLITHSGHPALGYYWPFWLGQQLHPDSLFLVRTLNFLFGALAIAAFGHLAARAFRGLAGRWEVGLLTVAFAVQPVFVANGLDMSLDYGVLAYFLATLALMYAGRLGTAALTGFLLMFSKETGLVLYTLSVVLYLSGAVRAYRWKEVRPLALPYLGFVFFCLFQIWDHEPISPYAAQWLDGVNLLDLYLPNPFSADLKMACLGPFVLEFQWIFTLFIMAGIIAGFCARRPAAGERAGWRLWLQKSRQPLHRPDVPHEYVLFDTLWLEKFNLPLRSFGFLLVGCLYTVSRTLPWTNQRYVLVLYPMVLLCFLAACLQLRLGKFVRIAILTCCLPVLIACNYRTLDPTSKAIAGTITIGKHKLLSISTIRPDVGALNRDALVYNLEHTYISYLLDDALAKIKPTGQTPLVYQGEAWWIMTRLDPKTFHRTESHTPPFIQPNVVYTKKIVAAAVKPPMIYYIAFPYLHNIENLAMLAPFYDIKDTMVFSDHGYELKVYRMTRKT
jgi:hypothetical protein